MRTLGIVSVLALTFAACAAGDSTRGAAGGDEAPGPAQGWGVFPSVYGPVTLGYDVVDGRKIHQGDMILEEEAPSDGALPDGAVGEQAAVIASPSRRWPEGVVYYMYDPALTGLTRISAAIAMWERTTNIRFIQDSSAPDRIRFKPVASGCRSFVGRVGGEQTIELDPGCSADAVAHEIGHAVGLHHEMQRISRDNDVVIGSCVVNNPNFAIYSPGDGQDFGPYDFLSLMQYDGCNFTCPNGEFHIARKSNGACVIGAGTLSAGDRNAIGWLYGYQNGETSQDYDNDGRADLVFFQHNSRIWTVRLSSGAPDLVGEWGVRTDRLVPGDYDGDGKTDFGVFRPSEGNWYIRFAKGGPDMVTEFGVWHDILVQGDYDGDGKTDPAIFRTGEGKWYVHPSAGGPDIIVQWGVQTDVAVPSDYDGDGKTDFAVYRPSEGNWYIRFAKGGPDAVIQWGEAADLPLPADYDGDGKVDVAVFRARDNLWSARPSSGGPAIMAQWGLQGDRFVPADYDNDKKADFAIFRPSTGEWWVRQSTNGAAVIKTLGYSGGSIPGSR